MGTNSENLIEKIETIDCIFLEKKYVSSNNESDPLMYFFEIISTKEKIEWKETKVLKYANPIKGCKYSVSYLVWVGNTTNVKRNVTRIENKIVAFYIKNSNSIIKENLKTGEIINLSR